MATKKEGVIAVNEVIKPQLSEAEAIKFIQELFGVQVESIKPLVSYDDLNFQVKLKTVKTPTNGADQIKDGVYVFKVLNSMDSKVPGVIDAQNAMMIFCAERGYHCNVPMKTLQGSHIAEIELGTDKVSKKHLARLLTFAEGIMLANVDLTEKLNVEMGAYLARMEQTLKNFEHSFLKTRQFIWMGSNTPQVQQFEYAITDPEKQKLIKTAYMHWNQKVLPVLPTLPSGFVHGDFNEQNILVEKIITKEENSKDEQGYKISGVIDFGDVSWSAYLSDLIICLVGVVTMGRSEEEVGQVIRGYCSVRPLTAVEWDVIWEALVGRMYTTLVMGAYTHSLDPENAYLLTTAEKGWEALGSMLRRGREATLAVWKDVVARQ